jgi:hypothetical protein
MESLPIQRDSHGTVRSEKRRSRLIPSLRCTPLQKEVKSGHEQVCSLRLGGARPLSCHHTWAPPLDSLAWSSVVVWDMTSFTPFLLRSGGPTSRVWQMEMDALGRPLRLARPQCDSSTPCRSHHPMDLGSPHGFVKVDYYVLCRKRTKKKKRKKSFGHLPHVALLRSTVPSTRAFRPD